MADPEKAMDVADGGDDSDDAQLQRQAISQSILKDPAIMSALQGKLDSLVNTSSGYIESLPGPVKKRLKALKKIQLETTKIEAKFYEEVHQLECKYHGLCKPLYDKRFQIVHGDYEPNEEECDWPSDDEDEDDDEEDEDEEGKKGGEDGEVELAGKVKKVKLLGDGEGEEAGGGKDGDEPPAKGVPEFWLTIFKNVDMLQEMVQEHDEPILASLNDVEVTFSDGTVEGKPMGFTLHFRFDSNEYFTNSVLTKEYEMKCVPSETDPFSFEGPEIFRCKGCPINWKQGKNVTVKTVRKMQRHKSKKQVREVTKQAKNDSFFNFFDPPPLPEDPEAEVDAETQDLLTADFEIGHYIRERIVPRAVLFFTGEILEEEDDMEEEEDEEDEEDGEGEEEEDDPDFDPSKAKGQNPECKQQ